jgi:hypothetical protein
MAGVTVSREEHTEELNRISHELLLQVSRNQSPQHCQPDWPQLNDYEYKFQDGDAAGTFQ